MIFARFLEEEKVGRVGGNIQTDFFGEPVDATHLSRSEISRGVALDDRRWPAPIRHGLVLSTTKMHTIWSEHTATESTCLLSKYVLISVLKLPFPRLERVRQQFHRMLFVKLCIEAGVEGTAVSELDRGISGPWHELMYKKRREHVQRHPPFIAHIQVQYNRSVGPNHSLACSNFWPDYIPTTPHVQNREYPPARPTLKLCYKDVDPPAAWLETASPPSSQPCISSLARFLYQVYCLALPLAALLTRLATGRLM